ncbi:MAG: thiol peroxidase [Deltaproteobacteria bacterium]|nr:thiol peroxidase [Deltaproteobacteria bacterium]
MSHSLAGVMFAVAVAVGGCGSSGGVGEADVVAYLKAAPPADQARVLAAVTPAPPERTDLIGRAGKPLTIVGTPPEVGAMAPDATLADGTLKPIKLADFRGKTVVLSVVPSIDTRVCEAQTHAVSNARAQLPASVVLITVSRDLPFAQTRFQEEAKTETLFGSDYNGGGFGKAWGLAVKESGLLARSVWVIDPSGKITYRELVADQTTEPDYAPLIAAAKAAAGG